MAREDVCVVPFVRNLTLLGKADIRGEMFYVASDGGRGVFLVSTLTSDTFPVTLTSSGLSSLARAPAHHPASAAIPFPLH